MQFKRYIRKIHLILGLASGLIVFVVAITGCLYVFKQEIESITQSSYRNVDAREGDFLPPSHFYRIGKSVFPDRHPHSIEYGNRDEAATIIYYEAEPEFYQGVYVNPYNGEILKVKDYEKGFFHFILHGHYYLWLPHDIGKPVVATATLIFVVMLISGIILWWPKKANIRQRFNIKWDARWRRLNFDLHSVLGFYISWVAVVLALTGLVWGFQWFADAWYAAAGGEKEIVYTEPESGPVQDGVYVKGKPVDIIWEKMRREYKDVAAIEIHYPHDAGSSIYVNIKPEEDTYWETDYRFFDRYTLEEIKPVHIWGRFEEASAADKLMRMNYDIHTGAILGLPGKILAFFASLFVASLPVSGILLWMGRNKKNKAIKNVPKRKNTIPLRKSVHSGVNLPNSPRTKVKA